MIQLLAATGLTVVLPFAFLTDNANCNGAEARWEQTSEPYYVNTTAQPFTGTLTSVQNAMDVWGAVNSSYFSWTYTAGTPQRGFTNDGQSAISFGDPDGDLGTGVLAATVSFRGGATHTYDAQTFRTISEMDIVFNNGLTFVPNSDIAGGCSNSFSIEAVLIHESGHGLGLQHPDQCVSPNDPEGAFEGYNDAVMYSAIAPCDDSKYGLELDDLEGVTYLYDNGQPLVYPGFTATNTVGYAPLTVQFTDESVGATSWSWQFGDGGSSSQTNPSYTYASAGNYTASLTVNGNIDGGSEPIQAVQPPTVDFSADVTSGGNPLNVNFQNLSSGQIAGYTWDFGDATFSNEENPSHEYLYKGTYNVKLTVAGVAGPVETVKEGFITVGSEGGDENGSPFKDFMSSLGCNCSFVSRGARAPGLPLRAILLVLGLTGAVVVARRRRYSPDAG